MNFEYDKSVNIVANSWRLHDVIQNESTKRKKHDPGKKTFFRGGGGRFFSNFRGGIDLKVGGWSTFIFSGG